MMRVYIHPNDEREFVSEPRRHPLTLEEREYRYELQVSLHCVKPCVRCARLLPMELFDINPDCCGPCLSEQRSTVRGMRRGDVW